MNLDTFQHKSQSSMNDEFQKFQLDQLIEDYDLSRRLFREMVNRVPGCVLGQLAVPSNVDQDLTIDTAYVPCSGQRHGLVIITAGVHGPETPVGANLQRQVLHALTANQSPTENISYLFIHAVNPYGFKYGRRVTENNVDLNRNFIIDPTNFAQTNPLYGRLNHVLNPDLPVDDNWREHLKFLGGMGLHLARNGMPGMIQGIACGQYQFPRGIMFGGHQHEPQVGMIWDHVLSVGKNYRFAMVLDIHTGYGPRGDLQLMPNPPASSEIGARWAQVFRDFPIGTTGGAEFYTVYGDFAASLGEKLEGIGVKSVPMLLEFGTLDSQTVDGSIATISRLIRENQNFWYGSASAEIAATVKRRFQELFTPSCPRWRQKAIDDGRSAVQSFIGNFERLVLPH